MFIFILSIYSLSEIKDLLNFRNPLPRTEPFPFSNEKKIGEWSVEKDGKASAFLAKSCSVFETKNKSGFDKMCNVFFRIRILQISHRFRLSFISINFARGFFF